MLYSGAYSGVTSISVVGFYLPILIPIYLGWRRKDSWILKRGSWHLGIEQPDQLPCNFVDTVYLHGYGDAAECAGWCRHRGGYGSAVSLSSSQW